MVSGLNFSKEFPSGGLTEGGQIVLLNSLGIKPLLAHERKRKPTTSSVQADVECAPEKGNRQSHPESSGRPSGSAICHCADGSACQTTHSDRASDSHGRSANRSRWSAASACAYDSTSSRRSSHFSTGSHHPPCCHCGSNKPDEASGRCRSSNDGASEGYGSASSSHSTTRDFFLFALTNGDRKRG